MKTNSTFHPHVEESHHGNGAEWNKKDIDTFRGFLNFEMYEQTVSIFHILQIR